VRRFIILGIALTLVGAAVDAQDKAASDTPKAAKSRKKLKEIVSVDYENTAIREVEADLKSQIEGLPLRVDFKGGVSGNLTITYKADKKTLEEVLNGLCKKKGGLGYYIASDAKSAEDGTIWITNRPNERGFRVEEESASSKTKEKSDDKAAGKEKNKGKGNAKDKAEAKEKKAGKDKAEASDDDPDKQEQDAARKLMFAKTLLDDGKTDRAKARLEEIVAKYAKTKAAEEAKELLKKLDK
jgi:hypothetical protein